jgi:hypothetical protein
MERAAGIEPASSVWKTEVLTITQRPLNKNHSYFMGVWRSSHMIMPFDLELLLLALKMKIGFSHPAFAGNRK